MNPFVIIRYAILLQSISSTLSFQFQQSPTTSSGRHHGALSSVDRSYIVQAAAVQLLSPSTSQRQDHFHWDITTALFSENNDNNDEFNVGETYEGDVDWDAEWKKVVTNQDQPDERPGKDFYKNDVEKVIGKTAKAAQEQISKIPKVKVEMPQPRIPMSLSGDAKLWLAVIVIISIGSALIGGAGNINAQYTNGGAFDI